jgi:two-component system, NarL family, response regulator DevR
MKRIRILIVDDHEMVREGLRSILKDDPELKIVGEAGDGEKALDLIPKLHPDIILLDIKMPGIDGVEVCRRVRARFPSIAVIALTTFMEGKQVQECIRAGARGYVLKDVERFQLKQILKTVASGESVIDSNVVGHMVPELQEETTKAVAGKGRGELTAQQVTILKLVAQGYSNKEIGTQIRLSENTVKSYVQDLLQKMGARNRVDAAMIASKRGWI